MEWKLFKNKNLALLVIGQFVSHFGSGMQSFAFSLYILHLTGSGTMFASVLAIGMVPRLIAGPICGVFADWFDRKKIIVYLDLLSAVIIGGLFFLSRTTELNIVHIYITVISMSLISAMFTPAIGTAIPSVVKKEELVGANALNRFTLTLCHMLYPVVAGLIFGLYGISVVLMINAVSFILSAISEMFIELESPNKKRTKPSYQDFKSDFYEGIKVIRSHKLIRNIMGLALAANALIAPAISVGLIFVANQLLEVTDWQLGILQTALVSGSLVGSLFTGALSKRYSLEKLLAYAVMAIGLLVVVIAFHASNFYIGLFTMNTIPFITMVAVAMMITSIAVITNIGVSSLMQREVPLKMLGRVSSVKETISMAAVPMGQMFFGMVFDYTLAPIPFIVSGTMVIMIGFFFSRSILEKKSGIPATVQVR